MFYVELSAFENLEKLDLSGNTLNGSLTIQGNEKKRGKFEIFNNLITTCWNKWFIFYYGPIRCNWFMWVGG
jgi:hypothetical protein